MSDLSKLWDVLDSARYSTPAGRAFALYLYKATERRGLKAPIDVLNVLLIDLHAYLDPKKYGHGAVGRAAMDIAVAIERWLRYLREEGHIVNFSAKYAFLLDGDRRTVTGGTVEVAVETPDGFKWVVKLTIDGELIRPQLLRYETRRLCVSAN